MGWMSECIAEANVESVTKLLNEYLADDTISDEAKEVVKKFAKEVIFFVGD